MLCNYAHECEIAITNETVIDCGNDSGIIFSRLRTKNTQNIYIRMIDYSQFYFVDATD